MARIRLKEVLDELGLSTKSYQHLEDMTGVQKSVLWKLCTDRKRTQININHLGALCDSLGVEVTDIIEHEGTFVSRLRSTCERLQIVVGSRRQVRLGSKDDGGLDRSYLDPYDVNSIGYVQSAVRRLLPGKEIPVIIKVLPYGENVNAEEWLGSSNVLTVCIGSPTSNPAILPFLEFLARNNKIEGTIESRVRLRTPISEEDEKHWAKRTLELLGILVDKSIVKEGRFDPPLGLQDLETPEHRIETPSRNNLVRRGTYSDAAIIFICEEPMFLGLCGVGGPGTEGAARYLDVDGLRSIKGRRIGADASETRCILVEVKQEKPKDGSQDDRVVYPGEMKFKIIHEVLRSKSKS